MCIIICVCIILYTICILCVSVHDLCVALCRMIIVQHIIIVGTFLGYSKSPKYREWTNDLTVEDLRKIEVGSKSAEDLAKALFIHLFKHDLEERPDDICATSNRLDGRQLCDPIRMRAIRCKYL